MNDQQHRPETLDLRSYLRPIWRRKWIVLVIVVVATAATYLISARQQKSYVASTTLYVQTADPTQSITISGSQAPPTTQAVADVAQLVVAQGVTNAVAHQIGMPVSSAGTVTATPSSNSDFVTVTASSHSPVLAARLANTYASAFLRSRQQAVAAEAVRDQRAAQATLFDLPSNLKNLTDLSQRQTVLQQIETYRQIALSPSAGAQQIDTAAVPAVPSSPKPKRDAIFGGVVGLVLALIAAFCLELLDRRLVRVSTVESAYDRPVLAVLPHVSDPTPLADGQRPIVPAPFLEELRSLMVKLRLSAELEAPRVIMVTSTLPREGKSTVARDLALVYAEAGQRVLVIDGDLRRPSMSRLFGIEADEGLVQVLQGEAALSEVALPAMVPPGVAKMSTNGHGPSSSNGADPLLGGSVDVLANGERINNPLAPLSSERMFELLAEARQAYDIVLLDTPPVLAVADCVPLLEIVDSVLLVARLGQTTEQAADRFTKLIHGLSNVTFSGVIANDIRSQFDDEGHGSYGRYGYDYYYGKSRRERRQIATVSAP